MSQVLIVTGASRGLGRAVVTAALENGHQVVAGVRRRDALDDLASRYADRIEVIELDVTRDDAGPTAVRAAIDRFGRVDALINNAGYANVAAIEDVDFADFQQQVDTNFYGVVRLTRAVLPIMRQQGSGHIIQVSSVGGRMATPGLSAYQSAKWAVGGFSSVLAGEVAPLGIKITILEPGGMRTDWAGSSMRTDPVRPEYEPTVGAMISLHSKEQLAASDPDKVAGLIMQLITMAEPPLRLLVGPDAYAYATAAGRRLLAEDERWRDLSESTVADDATPEQVDPMGLARH
jgi:NAD(P)-dependent dehydrogenase (short-subunit alcohol dehydrogenase family)